MHDYEELAKTAFDTLGDGEWTKTQILDAADLPANQYNWCNIRREFAYDGVLCHYIGGGVWSLKWRRPQESAGAVEMWTKQILMWTKNMRKEFVGLIQQTGDDAETYFARLIDQGHDPMTIYIIAEALDGALPRSVQDTMWDAYQNLLPDMPREMRDRVQARLSRIGEFTTALLEAPK